MIDKYPYCGSDVEFKDSSIIYGKSYGMVYICSNFPKCDAYVGVHNGSETPLGRLADPLLRYWKKLAHEAFDPIWKTRIMYRGDAYLWLSEQMGIPTTECHIGMFDVDECRSVIEFATAKFSEVTSHRIQKKRG